MDSLASALAFAYFNSLLQPDRTYLALFQQGRDDFALRPENMYALERAHVGTEDVITLDDLDRTQLLHSEAQVSQSNYPSPRGQLGVLTDR